MTKSAGRRCPPGRRSNHKPKRSRVGMKGVRVSNASPGEIFSGGGLPFVGSAMKTALAENGVPFGIVGAAPKTAGYGGRDETVFEIEVSAKAAKAAKSDEIEPGKYRLTLAHNDVRERQANDVVAALAVPNVTSIGPVFLVQVETKNKQHAWSISNEPNEGPVVPADVDSDAGDGTDSDDGIPY